MRLPFAKNELAEVLVRSQQDRIVAEGAGEDEVVGDAGGVFRDGFDVMPVSSQCSTIGKSTLSSASSFMPDDAQAG